MSAPSDRRADGPEGDGPLSGRRAVVTGGGRGIGAAVARALVEAGAAVLVAARTESEVEAVAGSLRDAGGDAHAATVDVTDEASVEALAERAAEVLGAVDVLVNSAGVAYSAPIAKTSVGEWDRIQSVNARGAFLQTRAFLPGMMERGRGRIVHVASVAGLAGARYIAAYAASKHALIGLVRSAADEAAASGVTVNAVCPAYVDTAMTRESVERIMEKTGRGEAEALETILATSPQNRLIEPDEVAGAVVWLCGEQARGVNGQAIAIDGGGVRP